MHVSVVGFLFGWPRRDGRGAASPVLAVCIGMLCGRTV